MNLRHNLIGLFLVVFSAGLLLVPSNSAVAQGISNAPGSPMEHVKSIRFLARGVRAQETGQYGLAYDNFLRAARDANKTAQFMVGLMYLDGTYREIDPQRAWAWMALASERGYPQYSEVADALWQDLGEHFQPGAREILEEELLPVFGDAEVVPRVAREMRRDRNRTVGTRVGSIGSVKILDTSMDPTAFANFTTGRETGMGLAVPDVSMNEGSLFFDRARWDYEHIVDVETEIFLGGGSVNITDLEDAEDNRNN